VRKITVQYDVSFVPPAEDTCALPASIGVPGKVPVAEDTPLWLFVSVKDTGPGLKPNELAILFKRFSRMSPISLPGPGADFTEGNKMIHTRYGGSGLGLFICRSTSSHVAPVTSAQCPEITELLGGRIEVKSDLGHGSVFRFFIKTAAAAPKSALAQYVENTSSGGPPRLAGAIAISPNPSSQSIPTVASTATVTSDNLAGMRDLHILIVEGRTYSPTQHVSC
jgi:hypothetical protein